MASMISSKRNAPVFMRRRWAGRAGRRGSTSRCVLIGYFEGIDSERGIAWRSADSLALRDFLGLDLHDAPPDHSTISRTRRLIAVETHRAVFTWVAQCLGNAGLIKLSRECRFDQRQDDRT
jgi:transposase